MRDTHLRPTRPMPDSYDRSSCEGLDPTVVTAPLTFDLEGAQARMDGNAALLNAMLDFFLSEVPPLIEQLDDAVERGVCDSAVRPAHTLKGQCLNFGVQPCSALLQSLEMTAKSGDTSSLRRCWPAVRDRVQEALAWVEKKRAE